MGNCLSKKSKPSSKNTQLSRHLENSSEDSDAKQVRNGQRITIKRNPVTNQLEGIPRSWVESGYCDPKIVSMKKVVDIDDRHNLLAMQSKSKGNDVDRSQADTSLDAIQIEGSLDTESALQESVRHMSVDKKEPYGIKNLPQSWKWRLKASEIEQNGDHVDSEAIIDLIRSQSGPEQKIEIRSLMKEEEFNKIVKEVEIIYGDAELNYIQAKQLGQGAACRVVEVRTKYKKVEQKYAMRVMRNKTPKDLLKIQQEIALMKLCECSNIVKHHQTYYDGYKISMFIDLMDWGCLTQLVQKCENIPIEIIAYIIKNILQGLCVLHDKKQIHRDIKSDNILLSFNGDVKIADFGFAVQLTREKERRESVVGTPAWMAPQLIRKTKYNEKVDIWSLGIVLLEICDKDPPYLTLPPLKAMYYIASKNPPTLKNWRCSELKDFYQKCIEKEPEMRPSCRELLAHPFLGLIKDQTAVKQQYKKLLEKYKN